MMQNNIKTIFEILLAKGVERLYHANSVITSCQFLRHGSLMSRGVVERKGLPQTKQASDKIDKNHNIWFDVFADSVDIHERASQANVYGPVLFVLDFKRVLETFVGNLRITKLNPTKWNGKNFSECWFTSINDLDKNFIKGRFDQMFVFRNCGGELMIKDNLKLIIVDDPIMKSTKSNIDYFSMAFGALRVSMIDGGLDVPMQKRSCKEGCKCQEKYKEDID